MPLRTAWAVAFAVYAIVGARSAVSAEDPVVEYACAVIAPGPNGKMQSTRLDTLHVLEATLAQAVFHLPADAPKAVRAVMCGRSSIVPAANDYKVLAAGFPFNIVNKSRVAALEMSEGQVRLRMIDGNLTPEEQRAVQERLNQLQTALRIPQ